MMRNTTSCTLEELVRLYKENYKSMNEPDSTERVWNFKTSFSQVVAIPHSRQKSSDQVLPEYIRMNHQIREEMGLPFPKSVFQGGDIFNQIATNDQLNESKQIHDIQTNYGLTHLKNDLEGFEELRKYQNFLAKESNTTFEEIDSEIRACKAFSWLTPYRIQTEENSDPCTGWDAGNQGRSNSCVGWAVAHNGLSFYANWYLSLNSTTEISRDQRIPYRFISNHPPRPLPVCNIRLSARYYWIMAKSLVHLEIDPNDISSQPYIFTYRNHVLDELEGADFMKSVEAMLRSKVLPLESDFPFLAVNPYFHGHGSISLSGSFRRSTGDGLFQKLQRFQGFALYNEHGLGAQCTYNPNRTNYDISVNDQLRSFLIEIIRKWIMLCGPVIIEFRDFKLLKSRKEDELFWKDTTVTVETCPRKGEYHAAAIIGFIESEDGEVGFEILNSHGNSTENPNVFYINENTFKFHCTGLTSFIIHKTF